MKKILLLLTLFCTLFMGTAKATEVQIGDPSTATGNYYLPFYTLYNYGISQQIYTAEEIGMAGTIDSLTLWLYNGGSNVLPAFNISIYMKEVDRDAFASTSDWEAMTEDDLVYSSSTLTVTNTTAQEYAFALDNSFAYSGTGNLLIAIFNNTGTYKSGLYSLVFTATGQAMSTQRDTPGAYDIAAPGVTGTSRAFKNVIKLGITSGGQGPTCDKPTDLDFTGVTSTSATLNWAGGSGTYDVEYKESSSSEWLFAAKNSTLTSTTLTNLKHYTTYNVRVKSKCDGGAESGYKSGSFTTEIGIPYGQNFDALSALPSDWKRYSVKLADVLAGTDSLSTVASSGWTFSSSTTGVFESKHIYAYIYGTSVKYWFVSPSIPMEENVQLSFTMALTKSSTAYTAITPGGQPDDRFVVLASVDNGATWTILREWNNTGSEYVFDNIANDGEEVAIDLSAYSTQTVKLAFYAESSATNGSNYLHLDDILVNYVPTCLKPTNLHEVAGGVAKNAIQVAWDHAGAELYKVQYKKDTAKVWSDPIDATTNPFTVTGLDEFTEYNIRVAAFCDPTDSATLTDYGKKITVKTATGVPFAQNFNISALPSEWKRYDAKLSSVLSGGELKSATTGWATVARAKGNNVFDSAYHAMLNIADTMNYWLVSPIIEMEAGYQLTFDLALTKADGGSVKAGGQPDDVFELLIFADGEWNEVGIWTNSGEGTQFDAINSSANGQTIKLDLNAYAGKNIQLAFYGESSQANGDNNLHIANLKIATKPACSPALSLEINDIEVTTATAVWTTDEPGSVWQYGLVKNPGENFTPADSLFKNDTIALTVAFDTLKAETSYAFFLRKACEGSNSEILVRTFKTYPAPKTVPWNEDFELMTANTVPTYWDNSASSTTTLSSNPAIVWGVYSYSNNKMLYMKNFSVQKGTAIINTPRINLAPENGCMLSFDYTHAASCDPFSVRISTDNGKNWTELASYARTAENNYTSPGEFTKAEINLAAYAGQIVTLQFYSVSNYGSGAIFVDNIKIEKLPDCLKPTNLAVSNVSAHGATLSWDNVEGGAWEYVCVPDSITKLPAYIACAQNSIQLDTLNEKTDYIFYLRTVCGDSKSDSIFVTFSTPCEAVSVADEAYVEDFEAYEGTTYSAAGVAPDCWTVGGTASVKPHVIGSGTSYYYTHSGTKALTFYGSGYCYAALPQFVEELNTLQIKFWMQTESASSGSLTLGYITEGDPGDFSTFTAIQAFANNNGSMVQREKMLDEVDAAAYRLVFRWYYSSQYSCCIDDITVEKIPSCLKPTDLAAIDSLTTTTSATITWTPGADETYYLVQYKKSADSIWSYVPDTVKLNADTTFTFTGLEPANVYNVRIAAWCNTADSTAISEYTAPVSIATLCEPYSIVLKGDYTEDFETYVGVAYNAAGVAPICWETGGTSTYGAPHVVDKTVSSSYAYVHEGNKSMNFCASSNSYTYAVLPEFADSLKFLQIGFWAQMENATNGVLYLGYVDDTLAFHALTQYANSYGSMAYYETKLDTIPDAAVRLAFVWQREGTSFYSCCIDDLTIKYIPDCQKPENVAAIDSLTTANSVTLAWEPQGSETAWAVQYKESTDSVWTTISADNDSAFVIDGLKAATYYDVQVAALCGATDTSEYTIPVKFHTGCALIAEFPFKEDFDIMEGKTSGKNLPLCWSQINVGTNTSYNYYPMVYKGTTYANSGTNSLKFYSYYSSTAATTVADQYAILPEMEGISALRIRFNARKNSASYDATFTVGVMTNPEDASTYVAVDTIKPSAATYEPFSVLFNSYAGAGKHIAIKMDAAKTGATTRAFYLDDIVVDSIPNCLEPKDLEAVLTKANGSVATLNWKAGKQETAWAVEYSLNEDFSDSIYVEVNDSTLALTGLLSDSTYYARVKAICGEDEESEWSYPVSFTPMNALVINDSTTTNSYVPFYGYYIHYDVKSQFVIPAADLEPILWDTITKLTFYSSTATAALTGSEFEVYMAPFDTTVISAEQDWDKLEKVMSKAHLSVADKQMVVTLSNPYQYQGGNLLIGFKLATKASSYGTTAYFYGKSGKTGASIGGYASSATGTVTMSQRNFLPKMKIDHVHGEMPSCFQVKDLAVSNLTASSATLSWKKGAEEQTAWQIAIDTIANFNPDTATLIDASANTYALADLAVETTYYIYVRANCSDGENEDFSVWSKLFTFQTASACQTPDNLKADSIATTSALISWNDYGQTGFNLLYTDGGSTIDTIYGVNSPYLLENLAAKTAYMVKVQAACAAANVWSQPMSFTTAYGIPFEEKFDATTIPTDWSQYSGLLRSVLNDTARTTASLWYFGTANSVFNSHARLNIYGTSRYHWLETPAINVAGDVQLSFDLALTKYSGDAQPVDTAQQKDDKFVVLVSTDNAATWTILRQWDNAGSEYVYNNIATTGEEVAINLAAYNGQSIKIAFYGESTVTGGDNNLHIDNVLVDLVPTCIKPQKLTVSDVKAHTAKVAWTAEEGQDAWQIALSTKATNKPDTVPTKIDVTTNPFVLTDLNPSTTYYVYLRANCGEQDGYSKWTDAKSFKTTIACPAPKNLKAELVPGVGDTAILKWTAGGDEAAWRVEYSTNANMSDSIVVVVEDTICGLTGLTAETKYYARILADCGQLDSLSAYTSIVSFTPTNRFELLVNDGTTTNTYLPIEGSYVDDGTTASQFIIPATALESIEWDSIKTLTFYASVDTSKWGNAQFEVYVTELAETTLAALEDWTKLTQVKASAALSVSNKQMVVAFDSAYQYQGGNLLIGIKQTVASGGDYKSISWYGVSAKGASIGGHGTGSYMSQRNFLPKMNIEYVPGNPPACPNPKFLTISNVTDSSAFATWKFIEGATWEYALVEGEGVPAAFTQIEENQNSIELKNLKDATEYTIYLRRACGENGNSEIVSAKFTTEAFAAVLPLSENFEGANHWKFLNGNEPNAWVIGGAAAKDSEKALYISNDAGVSNAYTTSAASATFATLLINVEETDTFRIAYDWKANGDFDLDEGELYDYMRVALISADSVLTAGMPALPKGYLALDNGGLYGATSWQHYQVDTTLTAGEYKLVIAWFNDGSDGDQTPAAIDNISIALRPDTPTAIETGAGIENKAVKFIYNNQVYIMLNGVIYNITGQKVEMK